MLWREMCGTRGKWKTSIDLPTHLLQIGPRASQTETAAASTRQHHAAETHRLLQTPVLQGLLGKAGDTGEWTWTRAVCCLCLAAAHALLAVVQEDIALIENLAGIKRRTQAPARYGNAYEKEYTGRGGRGYENDS